MKIKIESALLKNGPSEEPQNIDNFNASKINGIFDDDGNKINIDVIPKPALCLSCRNNDNPNEEVLCNLTRYDQKDDKEFICYAYSSIKG